MLAVKIFVLLMPLPAAYLIYSRFFAARPDFRKHAEALAAGIFCALLLYTLSPVIHSLIPSGNPVIHGFIKAAFMEKIGALVLLLLVLKYYSNISVVEAALSAVFFGIGFSIVENAAYMTHYGDTLVIIRSLFSLPIHMATCGILGFYLGKRALSRTKAVRIWLLIKGFILAFAVHGVYDTLLLSEAPFSYITAPLLVASVVTLEIFLARAQTIPSMRVLEQMNIRHEDWIIIDEQFRYERWILQSMGRSTSGTARLFIWEPGVVRMLAVITLMGSALLGLSYRDEIPALLHLNISPRDSLMILGFFPISISAILMIAGSVNPKFFAQTEMKIPIILEAEPSEKSGIDETYVTYSLSGTTCFLKTHEPFSAGRVIPMTFTYGSNSSGTVDTEVLWENYSNRQYPYGSVLRIRDRSRRYLPFILRYRIFKVWKGIIFNLRLPGFESSRKLFAQPLTAMQEDRFFTERTTVFNEGDEAKNFYLLKKGRVSLHKQKGDGSITLGHIEQGDVFGEMAVIPGRKRGSTAVCDTDSIIAVADRSNLSNLIRYNPDFAVSMIQMLAERTEASETILLEYIALLERKGNIL